MVLTRSRTNLIHLTASSSMTSATLQRPITTPENFVDFTSSVFPTTEHMDEQTEILDKHYKLIDDGLVMMFGEDMLRETTITYSQLKDFEAAYDEAVKERDDYDENWRKWNKRVDFLRNEIETRNISIIDALIIGPYGADFVNFNDEDNWTADVIKSRTKTYEQELIKEYGEFSEEHCDFLIIKDEYLTNIDNTVFGQWSEAIQQLDYYEEESDKAYNLVSSFDNMNEEEIREYVTD